MKTWQIVLIVIALVIILLIFMSMRKKPIPTAVKKTTITEVNPDMILHINDEGEIVRLMQQALNEKLSQFNLYGQVDVDGVFGQSTEYAIKRLTQGLLSSEKNNISFNNIRYRTNW